MITTNVCYALQIVRFKQEPNPPRSILQSQSTYSMIF